MIDYLIPMILLLSSAFVLRKRESSYNLLLEGAGEGLDVGIAAQSGRFGD